LTELSSTSSTRNPRPGWESAGLATARAVCIISSALAPDTASAEFRTASVYPNNRSAAGFQ
jgi:hypothetical protein